jgi:hypothetical protein
MEFGELLRASLYAIAVGKEPDSTPVRDVVIANNAAYDTGRDKVSVDGRPQVVPPSLPIRPDASGP